MSAVFNLYKIYDPETASGEVPRPLKIDEDTLDYLFSDGKVHKLIDLDNIRTQCRWSDKLKSSHKLIKKITKGHYPKSYCFVIEFNPEIDLSRVCTGHYLCADIVKYAQGWYLKNRFFKKKYPTVWCNSKKQMEKFFDKYLDYKDPTAKMVRDQFTQSWEDGMLFECSW